jgi:hypothetical protein
MRDLSDDVAEAKQDVIVNLREGGQDVLYLKTEGSSRFSVRVDGAGLMIRYWSEIDKSSFEYKTT